jgi:hypothetical protein
MIRTATADDITGMIALARTVLEKSPVLPPMNEQKARRLAYQAINSARMCAFVAERDGKIVGFLLGCTDDYWWGDAQFASDIAFVCHPNHGNYAPGLIRKLEKWAAQFPKVIDVTLGISSGLDKDGRTGRMYQNCGYAHVGGMFTKKLKGQHA